jgi:hypothetical protein
MGIRDTGSPLRNPSLVGDKSKAPTKSRPEKLGNRPRAVSELERWIGWKILGLEIEDFGYGASPGLLTKEPSTRELNQPCWLELNLKQANEGVAAKKETGR